MSIDPQELRLDGVYQQREADRFMQRVKVPAGALSSTQALRVADLADRYAGGRLHLTTRGSIELHDVAGADLSDLKSAMAAAGLTGRGACGGAVRGITCSTSFSVHYPRCLALARRLHRHFAGNPDFEGLPKKFKIAVEGEALRGRQLIQDLGLVYAGDEGGEDVWDLWCAGGLGREPKAGFLLAEREPEARVFALAEALLRVYMAHGRRGQRLKNLVAEIGEAAFRELLRQEKTSVAPAGDSAGSDPVAVAGEEEPVTARIFAGELSAEQFRGLARLAAAHAGGMLLLTADQDVTFLPADEKGRGALCQRLLLHGFAEPTVRPQPVFRVCPGSHECKMGLAPTRDLARQLLATVGAGDQHRVLAISGCPNSCSQPQLADLGVITTRRTGKGEEAEPHFTLVKRGGADLAEAVEEVVGAAALSEAFGRHLASLR